MADLEGLTRALIKKGYSKDKLISKIIDEYHIYKEDSEEILGKMAEAVYEECIKSEYVGSDELVKTILEIPKANVTVGKQGVGCRGLGDFFVHKLIGNVATSSTEAYLSPKSLDDAGAVFLPDIKKDLSSKELLVVSKMEGMHSRLSDFPFIAGFHVTRAALRDVLVKGAEPISIFVDIHLGDDADVGKLFDFMSGVSAVADLADVPITGGSTLRIGGDMVIGTRITGGIGVVGVCTKLLARRKIKPGDKVLMIEGSGGGTIATTAIYSGNHDVLKETINIKFLEASKAVLKSNYIDDIHAMCDVTNGGLRGDLYEINYESGSGVVVYEERVRDLVNSNVLKLLEMTGVDYLGVSLDALLLYVDPKVSKDIIHLINSVGVKVAEIGEVIEKQDVIFKNKDGEEKIIPRFRESAYTKVKQVVGEDNPEKIGEWEKLIEESANRSMEKRRYIVNYIKSK